jgi:hypothetical protein
MKHATLLLFGFLLAGADPPQPAIPYFAFARDVRVSQPDRQNYFVLDLALWNHSRRDLGDLRLYDGTTPVPYAISQQNAAVSTEQLSAKILNLGDVSGHTEFDVDASEIAEYDRISLVSDAKDFVATATVFGESEPGKPPAELARDTVFDFSSEHLGSNFVLKLPSSSFRYIHVRLSSGIRPQQIKSVTIANLREQQAAWVSAGTCGTPRQEQHATVIACAVPNNVPLQRLLFQVDPVQINFYRSVSVKDSKGIQLAGGSISRVRINRGGTLVTNEELAINRVVASGELKVRVENGDNSPLAIVSIQPQALEQRVYFDPQGKTLFKLYYGDATLPAPFYDYARFFQKDAGAVQAELSAATMNGEYTGRPDDRPWSERHTLILWGAMLIAIVALAGMAIRGLWSARTA